MLNLRAYAQYRQAQANLVALLGATSTGTINLGPDAFRELAAIEEFHAKDARAAELLNRQQATAPETLPAVALTVNDRSILTAMLELKATPEKPEPSETIVVAALGDVDHAKAFTRLKKAGLVDAKAGIGRWLTESGKKLTEKLAWQ